MLLRVNPLISCQSPVTYPWGQSQTPDGRVLENNGVVPDVEVALDRASLLQGRDTQLEAAIEYVAERIIE